MRILEVRAKPVEGLSKTETDELSASLQHNYGHAYIPYLQYIMNDIDGIKELYKTTQFRLDQKLGFTPADRFHSVLVTNGIVGLIVAKRAGLIDYDTKKITDWLVGVVTKSKAEVSNMDVSAEGTLSNYIAENWNSILRIESTQDSRTLKKDEIDHLVIPDATPRVQFVARYEYDVKMLYLYLNPLKEWCVKKQVNYEGLLDALKRGRTKAKIEKKRMGKGTRMSMPALYVLHVNCEGFMDDDREEENLAAHKAALEGDALGASVS
jgi:hypothetical protein